MTLNEEIEAENAQDIYHHHHHVALTSRVSLTFPRHPSLSFIARGKSSRLYPVSAQSRYISVLPGRLAFDRPFKGVHRSISLLISSLLLQQCPACLVRLTLLVFEMGDWWPYSCYFVGLCLQDLFNTACSILV